MEERRVNEIRYAALVHWLKVCFPGKNGKELFLRGGCYYFAKRANEILEDSVIMWNRSLMHCGVCFNGGLYDVTGRITKRGYREATKKDISYMEKHFIPAFDADRVDAFLEEKLLRQLRQV